MQPISIGRVARESGISIETIRFYEHKGLMEEPERRANGYRQYRQADIARLKFIQQAKGLGFTLNEIRELLSLRSDTAASCREIRIVGSKKLEEIEHRIKSLHKIKRALKKLVQQCPGKGPKSDCPILEALDS